MGWFSWWKKREDPFCAAEFGQIWSSFVDAFTDTIHANGPAGKPPETEEPRSLPLRYPEARRVVAIGDLHGDLDKTRRVFRLAGLTNAEDRWIGGQTVCVQVGDQLDRGDNELAILYFLERLQQEAEHSGGAVHVINGNHETLNVWGRFRFATQGGVREFYRWHVVQKVAARMKSRCQCSQGWSDPGTVPPAHFRPSGMDDGLAARWAALQPGGPVTRRFLARHPTVLQVGGTVFVHGGLLPKHVDYGLDRINQETLCWMMGGGGEKPRFLLGKQSVVWSRDYSHCEEHRCDCDALRETLARLGAERMVVGHTIQQKGINSACDGQVLRVDVGMSRGCGDSVCEALEILDNGAVNRLVEDAQVERIVVPKADTQPASWFSRLLSMLPQPSQTSLS